MELNKGKIYLAAERGHTETEWFRSYNSFNFGGYQNPHKQPFGALYVWNDDTLAGGKSIQLTVEENSWLFLLPVVGAVLYTDTAGQDCLLEAGQSFCCFAGKGNTVTLRNPYAAEPINFLHGWLQAGHQKIQPALASFSLDEEKNKLVKMGTVGNKASFWMGKFDGREEGRYTLSETVNRVFVFIIQGAFEVQNRLLEARDGLALWDLAEVEFEALSNEAILLLLQLP